MQSDKAQMALDRVIDYCNRNIHHEGSPTDDEIETCEGILKIINEELDQICKLNRLSASKLAI